MPYSIIHNHPDCPKESGEMGKDQIGGHAVVKDSDNSLIGCHKTHESAEEHLVALNIAMSEEKSLNNSIETRAVDLSAPAFMKKNMERGLDNLNKAGSGLTSKTIRDARNIINTGKVSPAKARLMFPWHARHLSDLKREKSNPNDPDTWRGSDVAFLLWGSNPWSNPMQAGDWAKRKVEQLNKEDRSLSERAPSEPAPKEDQIKGSKKNKEGSATGKSNNIKFNERTLKAINTIAKEHNESVSDMASWRKLRIPTAKAVVRRGFGAYSGSHRPGVSRQAWGLARLKAFSYLLKKDRPKNSKYVGDNDLLPESHPRFSGKEEKSQNFYDIKLDAMTVTTKILNKQSRINTVNKETENRSFTLANVEIREKTDGELTYNFSGYASVFDKPYGVRDSKGAYTETIKPGAFKKTLQEQDDVRFLVNHDGIPLARSSSGTLSLEEDDYGLYVEAELDPNNPTVAEVASAMKRGDLDQMSFAFAAVRDDFNGEVRDVQEVRLFDVSVVTYPANSWAGANLRGVDLGEYQKELVEARNGDRAIEVLEQIINKLEKESELDIRSESNPDIEILKIKMKRNGLLKDVTPED